MARKNRAAVALGRKGGLKGGPARAAKMTPGERSESARKAVQARWMKAKPATTNGSSPGRMTALGKVSKTATAGLTGTSDTALMRLLSRLKATVDPKEIRQLSDQIERIVFRSS